LNDRLIPLPGGTRDEFTCSEELHSMIYDSLDKAHRFALLKMLIDNNINLFTNLYSKMLLRDYEASLDNTPEQSQLIQNIRSMSKQES
jgi:hypothetical protein